MNTPIIVIVAVGCLIVAWFAWSLSWMAKQTLLGTWAAALPDGSHVTLQFEGERRGGIYKQLSELNGVAVREFGHWTVKTLEMRLIILATDVKDHPRFGLDTIYWVNFTTKGRVTINGPDRPKWTFQRAAEGVRLDFDVPQTTV